MAVWMCFAYTPRNIWSPFLTVIFLSILTWDISSASSDNSEECYCIRTSIPNIARQWNNWYGRYDNIVRGNLYSFATCKFCSEDSSTIYDICSDDCKYITFLDSKIGILKVNSFIDMPTIQEIYLNSSGINRIHLGAFSGISKLQVLHLEDNNINKISKGYLNSLISLKILDLHRNDISIIESESFFGLIRLENLDLSQNAMQIIPAELFDPLESLESLNMSHNYLTVISFELSVLPMLKTLDLSWNRIEIIDVCFNGSNLNSLYLQANQITFLNDSCFPVSLTTLFVQRNNITELNNGVFDELTELNELDVSRNGIEELSVDLFMDCVNLHKLDLSQNDIYNLKTGIFSGTPELKFLNISYIKIKTLEPHTFIPLNHLEIFDFGNNELSDIDATLFDHLNNLQEVYISGNNFSCSEIASIILQSKMKNFSVIYDKIYTTENVNGMPCRKKNDTESVVQNGSHKKSELFSEDWKIMQKEIFEKISKNFNDEIGDLMDVEKASFNNSLDEFSNKQEHMFQQYKIMMESEKADLKKFIIDLLHTLNKSNSVDSTSIHKTIDKHFHAQNTKLQDNLMKFSKDLETLLEKRVPKIEYSALNTFKNIFNSSNSSTGMLKRNYLSDNNNSTTNNQYENLSETINQLKMILIVICAVCIFFYLIEKISVMCWRRCRNDKDSFDVSQELPIIRNY